MLCQQCLNRWNLLTTTPGCCCCAPRCAVQGVEVGIGVGVGLSLVIVIYKTAFPRITTLGRLPDTNIYRCVWWRSGWVGV